MFFTWPTNIATLATRKSHGITVCHFNVCLVAEKPSTSRFIRLRSVEINNVDTTIARLGTLEVSKTRCFRTESCFQITETNIKRRDEVLVPNPNILEFTPSADLSRSECLHSSRSKFSLACTTESPGRNVGLLETSTVQKLVPSIILEV